MTDGISLNDFLVATSYSFSESIGDAISSRQELGGDQYYLCVIETFTLQSHEGTIYDRRIQ